LYNATVLSNLKYIPENYQDQYGFWAYFIYPTTKVESVSSFICLNTYDRAYFTFGFMQFAVHVPNGDFIFFLKDLLKLPNAKDYFPRLEVINGRIFYKSDSGSQTQLEFDNTSQPLMEYFNPTTNDVEHQELICSARLIHWATNDPEHRRIQVENSIHLYQKKMSKYSKRLSLHNYPAKVCFMICDILHHGRGSYDMIAYAIDTNGDYELAYNHLCLIGEGQYQQRINTLKSQIKILETNGIFNKKYNSNTNTFE
jgi:hypothetical protein